MIDRKRLNDMRSKIYKGLSREEQEELINAVDKLQQAIIGLGCAQGNNFRHAGFQWRLCAACSLRRGLGLDRGD